MNRATTFACDLTAKPLRLGLVMTAAAVIVTLCSAHAAAGEATAGPAATGQPATGQAAVKPQQPARPEASIPFVNHGGLRDFSVQDDEGIYFQAANGRWYYGKFFSRCLGIQFAESIKVLTGAVDTLDRWSRIQSRDSGACPLTSLTESDPPAGRKPKPP